MRFTCPNCRRPLYNRRRPKCEFCNATVPDVLLLSPRQQADIDRMKKAERATHRTTMSRELGGDGGTSFFVDGGGGISFGDCGGGDAGGCGCD